MKNKFLKTIGCLAAALALTACNDDETADGNRLPEGKYPVTFIATGLQMPAATRTTADGFWEDNEAVAVKIGDEVKRYVADVTGAASTTLKPAEGSIPFYWESTADIKVSAWYLGTRYYTSAFPTDWSVQTNQNNYDNGYQRSDFLYAPEADIDFKGTKPLTFYHQTAKVVVNIRSQGVVNNDDENIKSVTINAVTDGTFQADADGNYRLSAKTGTGVPSADIIFKKLSSPNADVVFKDGEKGEPALASYQALVIPQTLNANTSIKIQIEGYNTFTYTPTGSWEGGTQYTYNLTIDGKGVKVNAISTIGWTDGGTGEGSVEI